MWLKTGGHTLGLTWRVRSGGPPPCFFVGERAANLAATDLVLSWGPGRNQKESARASLAHRLRRAAPRLPRPPGPPSLRLLHPGPRGCCAGSCGAEPPSPLTRPGLCVRVLCQERVKGSGLICPLITVKRSNECLPKAWVFLCRLSGNLHSPFIHPHLPLWGGLSFQTQPSAACGGSFDKWLCCEWFGREGGRGRLGRRGQLPTVMDSWGVK